VEAFSDDPVGTAIDSTKPWHNPSGAIYDAAIQTKNDVVSLGSGSGDKAAAQRLLGLAGTLLGAGIQGVVSGTKGALKVPGRVQSRINLRNGSRAEGAGWNHLVHRHFNPGKNASQFTVSQPELRKLLQSKQVVGTPVSGTLHSADGIRYVREVNVGSPIGLDKYSGFQPTSTMTVLTDKFGNLVTATPGVIK